MDVNFHRAGKVTLQQVEVTGTHWLKLSTEDIEGAELTIYIYPAAENSPVELEILSRKVIKHDPPPL